MSAADTDLRRLVAAELAEPVDPRVGEMAAALAAIHAGAARAVLFYGSCLRERQLEGLMLDFYLIVSDYRRAYRRGWLATANRLIPPNVFPFEHRGLTAKYAVLSEEDFARECRPQARSVSVWARFSQPSRLVWAADPAAADAAVDIIAEAAPTLFALTRPMMFGDMRYDPLAIFRAGYALTYAAELRAERRQRAGSIVDADPERYRRIGRAALARAEGGGAELGRRAAARAWRARQRKGKALTLLRLLKASATFANGIDYLAWKINRHAGTRIEVRPWQRRWPLVAGLILLPRLLKRGAIR
ncbi:MAG: hypothetical protein JOZ90_12100 [Alphaproteobacteria bacterium]|nr:hypothetical protein [Alphaproteobacteria bacterium]MBV9371351.1 hypothetical protein [Alphaproteobacteria bacterium]MBV9901815.1 hypothetical protein [Alphaproteobacteria bacterium]